ncbi:MAG: response regulator [Rhodospirillum sp.]|nr:response regulator [Rhodospirillum sp.]MCF8488602.1 response regulator [Rhodospirillum sp.]MCF8499694.1 response regulator [Rhodospirillum sp.]
MSETILIVDDDVNLLAGMRRLLRRKFTVETVDGGEEALLHLAEKGPPAVVLCDMRMKGLNGVETLRAIRERAPDTVRMMLTGNADLRTAIDAINEGAIFRFLNKPCPPVVLEAGLSAALEQHRLITAERELLEKTLSGSIKVVSDLLGMAAPRAFARSMRNSDWVRRLSRQMNIPRHWRLELATLLAPLGLLSLPPDTLVKLENGGDLTEEEQALLEQAPEVACNVIRNIPRLADVARIVFLQNRGFDGSGFPKDGPRGSDLPVEARILKLLNDLGDVCVGSFPTPEDFDGLPDHDIRYDPAVFKRVRACLERAADPPDLPRRTREVSFHDLCPGMILAEDARLTVDRDAPKGTEGRLILAHGLRISEAHVEVLRNLARVGRLHRSLVVYVEEREDEEEAFGGAEQISSMM